MVLRCLQGRFRCIYCLNACAVVACCSERRDGVAQPLNVTPFCGDIGLGCQGRADPVSCSRLNSSLISQCRHPQVFRSTLAFFERHLGASASERYPRPAIDERRMKVLNKLVEPRGELLL